MINLLYVDLFCGAGGTSTGVEKAMINGERCAKIIACINHDINAIKSHKANHKEVLHFTEDIRTLLLDRLVKHVARMRSLYPEARLVLWASLECTNFSKAKGGMARDADSRTLANSLFRYIEAIDPDIIQIENVEEFMAWGELNEKGKPVSMKKGTDYIRWINRVQDYGYTFSHRILNAADFGAVTSRKRFFGQFSKYNIPISWPEPTHAKNPQKGGMFGELKPWRAVRPYLDLNDEGKSIFDRKIPLAEKTLERIYAGLIKFVAGGKDAFLVKFNSMSKTGGYNAPGIDEPFPAITTQNRLAIANINFISKYFSGHPEHKNISIDGPAHTVKTKDNHSLVTAEFLAAYYSSGDNVSDLDSPCPTLRTKDTVTLVQSSFMVNSYTSGGTDSSLEKPCPAITGTPKQNVVSCFIDQQFGNGTAADIEKPLGAIATNPEYNIIQVQPWILDTNFRNTGKKIDEPLGTITANHKWHYLMNPQFNSAGGSVDAPCFTLIARMDKMPPYLIVAENGHWGIKLNENDSEMTVKIKFFMALYNIADIKMRMLKIQELLTIMGFPADYVLLGKVEEKKKYIGNAVEVNMSKVLCESTACAVQSKSQTA